MTTFLSSTKGQDTDQPAALTSVAIPASDGTLEGLSAAMNSVIHVVNRLNQQFSSSSSSSSRSSTSGSGGRAGLNIKKKPEPRLFLEVSRQTEEVTVKDDVSGAELTYTQITQLIWRDGATGDTIKWHL